MIDLMNSLDIPSFSKAPKRENENELKCVFALHPALLRRLQLEFKLTNEDCSKLVNCSIAAWTRIVSYDGTEELTERLIQNYNARALIFFKRLILTKSNT